MKNHIEILDEIASRIDAFESSIGEMEENLLPPARVVLSEPRLILEQADPYLCSTNDQ